MELRPFQRAGDVGARLQNLPIARASRPWVEGGEVTTDVEFPPRGIHPQADQIHDLVAAGFLTDCSVGFRPGEYRDNAHGGKHFTRGHELFELSVVAIGSNRNASVVPSTPYAARMVALKSWMGIRDHVTLGRMRGTPDALSVYRGCGGREGTKSDQHPTAYCPRGRACPSRAAQLALCPDASCPIGRYGTEPPVEDKQLFDIDLTNSIDRADLAAIKEAMLGGTPPGPGDDPRARQ